ncbi:MAG TPA: CYTH domain-containing protein [Candidatus Paceibacterota bacterium]|jgi:adenylate cyclase class 2|nr:CYTH domain-containing protein [Candidatus Paceibacterota bacterium]
MQTEIEAKFLDIDVEKTRAKLREVGAVLEYPERLMKRTTYDLKDKSLRNEKAWVRVRDEGSGKITLSYKKLVDRTLHGTKEITVDVSSFETTCEFLEACGFESKSYQETKREKWMLGKSEITIDTWPWIPTFLEIESESEEEIKRVADLVGFDWGTALHGSVEVAYQKVFNVTEDEIDSWKEITFILVPEWLEIKRK